MTQEEKAYKEDLNGNSEGKVPDRQQRGVEQAKTQMFNFLKLLYLHMRHN